MKKQLLEIIKDKMDALDEKDAEGHIWWSRFEELSKNIPQELIPSVNLGEIFTVEGKMYSIIKPDTPSQDTNDHGHKVILLTPMNS